MLDVYVVASTKEEMGFTHGGQKLSLANRWTTIVDDSSKKHKNFEFCQGFSKGLIVGRSHINML